MSRKADTAALSAYLRERYKPVTVYRAMRRQGSTISQNAVENWFRGGSLPQLQYVVALAEALGVTCEEVCGVCGEDVS